jgi:L-asparaginase II
MDNELLAEVTRGGRVESRHRGAVAVLDADGAPVFQTGDIDLPVFPRSAVKAIQALPLLETGAADRFGLTDAELALACASHSGEAAHAETAEAMLRKAGRDGSCLECGAHWPLGTDAAQALAASGGRPSALHNNCSGKHAGFVCTACAIGTEPAGYVGPEHPVMRMVTAALAEVTGTALDCAEHGTDGCSIPAYALPLRALALGFARFGTGRGFGPVRAAAAHRIRTAVAAHPFMVAGTGRFDTELMGAFGVRTFVKTGAEGVYCAALPELGLGLAIKCDDGAGRAAQVITATLIRHFLKPGDDPAASALDRLAGPELRNWNGVHVGALRPAGPLSALWGVAGEARAG